jgi:hypothetical protein
VNFDEAEIRRLIAGGEGRQVEFKRGLPRDEKTARTLAAFANTRGGILFVGVGDRRQILGAPKPREVVRRLRTIAAASIEPPLSVETSVARVDGRAVVWCSVPLSPHRPHAVLRAGREPEIVVRAGSSNRAADGATLRAIREPVGAVKRPGELERRVLAWVESRARTRPGGDATSAAFAKAHNVGVQRARRAFVDLERAGLLVGHGSGSRRVYSRA